MLGQARARFSNEEGARLKVLPPVGSAEPTDWLVSVTDSASGLQVAGGIGYSAYMSSTGTNAPVLASVDDLWAGPHP